MLMIISRASRPARPPTAEVAGGDGGGGGGDGGGGRTDVWARQRPLMDAHSVQF